MEEKIMPIVYGVIGLVVLAIIINVAIGIFAPQAISNAVIATTSQNYTVNGVTYTVNGNGQTAQLAAQTTQDSINLVRATANVLLGVVFLVLIVVGVVGLFKGKRH